MQMFEALPEDIPLPPAGYMFMEKDHQQMLVNGETLLTLALEREPLPTSGSVLDLGCGYGRLAYALIRSGFKGDYLELDILPQHVLWLQNSLTPIRPKFKFHHLDAQSARYRPDGGVSATAVCLPALERKPDLFTVLSVFTHMYPAEVEHYIQIIAEAMSPTSVMYCTFFLINAESEALEQQGKSAYPLKHRLDANCKYYDEKDPLWAIGYRQEWVLELFDRHGLEVEHPILYGLWCGRAAAKSGQDSLFVRKKQAA